MSDLQILKFNQENPITDKFKKAFYDINYEWVSSMFSVEEIDEQVMSNPNEEIIDKGGQIIFAVNQAGEPLGTAALMPDSEGGVELTKMGVFESARGLGAGKLLLSEAISLGVKMKPKKLYLLTNKRCESAIHLYLKQGFVHSSDIMNNKGACYARCNVAMVYQPMN